MRNEINTEEKYVRRMTGGEGKSGEGGGGVSQWRMQDIFLGGLALYVYIFPGAEMSISAIV